MFEKYNNIRILYSNAKNSFYSNPCFENKYFSFDMKCTNMESLEDLQLNANDIPIMVKEGLTGACCVRDHHLYQSKWEAKVESELKACHETRAGVLVEDKYAMAPKRMYQSFYQK